MNNDEWFANEKDEWVSGEVGSDELLSNEELRLPESASILVRLHAVRAWLTRRQQEMNIEMGEAALELEEALAQPAIPQKQASRPRRRERDRERASQEERLQRIQQAMLTAQQQQSAYEEAQTLLEDYVAHTGGERVLVEYYLALEDLVQAYLHTQQPNQPSNTPWLHAMLDVQHRIERVGTPETEEGS